MKNKNPLPFWIVVAGLALGVPVAVLTLAIVVQVYGVLVQAFGELLTMLFVGLLLSNAVVIARFLR